MSGAVAELRAELKKRALKVLDKPVKLASGQMSHVYVDSKKVSLFGPTLKLLGEIFYKKIRELDSHGEIQIAGVSVGGDPLVAAVLIAASQAQDSKILGGLLVRKEAKSHGATAGRRVEGEPSQGTGCWLVEDVLSTGGSAQSALDALKSEGYKPRGVIVILDREMGGLEKLKAQNKIEVLSLFKLSEL
jgi:orotate phosphoribosyltransferase